MKYIADVDDLELNMPFKAKYHELPIVIYKTTTGIYALHDQCSHERFPLSESAADNDSVECQLHGSTFALNTGKPYILPAVEPVKTFPVTVIEGKVYIDD